MARKYSRREFVIAGGNALFAAAFFHARCIEPFWPEINTKTLSLPFLSEKLRVLHISDLHVFDAMPIWYFENVFEQLLSFEVDFAVFTGDFITDALDDPGALTALLKIISARVPSYACLGNHDGGAWARYHRGYSSPAKVLEVLERAGIQALNNESTSIFLRGQEVQLSGTTDLWTEKVPDHAFSALSPDKVSILLAHNPDTKDVLADEHWHLMLSGHTHGGQVVYPIIGGSPFCVVKDKRYVAGLHPWKDRMIHTSRGVGSIHGVRAFCAPELTVLELLPRRAA